MKENEMKENDYDDEDELSEDSAVEHHKVAKSLFSDFFFLILGLSFMGVLFYWINQAYKNDIKIVTVRVVFPKECERTINRMIYYQADCAIEREIGVEVYKMKER